MSTGLLSYLYLLLRYPRARDFLRMGVGIESRQLRCAEAWRRHLHFSKQFQAEAFNKDQGRDLTLSILGAGRLLDVNLRGALEKYARIALYDADPGVLSTWKRQVGALGAKGRVDFHLTDLTGSLDIWTASLKLFLKSAQIRGPAALAEFLSSYRTGRSPIAELHCDTLVSLNLLSQIPIYWRDRVHEMVKKAWGIDMDASGQYEPELQSALDHTMKALEVQHLELLAASTARRVILITDVFFFYYRKDLSPWQCEPALSLDEEQRIPRGFNVTRKDSWLWHLAPQGIEHPDHGELHEVHAWELERVL